MNEFEIEVMNTDIDHIMVPIIIKSFLDILAERKAQKTADNEIINMLTAEIIPNPETWNPKSFAIDENRGGSIPTAALSRDASKTKTKIVNNVVKLLFLL